MPITAPANVIVTGLDSAALSDLTGRLKRALLIDFDDVDERLQECIGTAKGQIERYTGCLLSPAVVTVNWSAFYDYEDLPKGPVRGVVSATTLSGSAVTLSAAQLGNDMFPRLNADFATGIALSYPAGYDLMNADMGPLNLPNELQEAVVQYAANLYDNGTRDWRGLASQFKRWGWGS